MTERVPHDADGIPTYDGVIAKQGRTGRYTVRFPTDANLPVETVVRIVLDGSEYRTQAVRPIREDGIEIRGVLDSARDTRDSRVSDRHLTAWVEDKGLEPGRTVHLDVVVTDFQYGLRAPGKEAVYHPREPDSTLRNIAEDL